MEDEENTERLKLIIKQCGVRQAFRQAYQIVYGNGWEKKLAEDRMIKNLVGFDLI